MKEREDTRKEAGTRNSDAREERGGGSSKAELFL